VARTSPVWGSLTSSNTQLRGLAADPGVHNPILSAIILVLAKHCPSMASTNPLFASSDAGPCIASMPLLRTDAPLLEIVDVGSCWVLLAHRRGEEAPWMVAGEWSWKPMGFAGLRHFTSAVNAGNPRSLKPSAPLSITIVLEAQPECPRCRTSLVD